MIKVILSVNRKIVNIAYLVNKYCSFQWSISNLLLPHKTDYVSCIDERWNVDYNVDNRPHCSVGNIMLG